MYVWTIGISHASSSPLSYLPRTTYGPYYLPRPVGISNAKLVTAIMLAHVCDEEYHPFSRTIACLCTLLVHVMFHLKWHRDGVLLWDIKLEDLLLQEAFTILLGSYVHVYIACAHEPLNGPCSCTHVHSRPCAFSPMCILAHVHSRPCAFSPMCILTHVHSHPYVHAHAGTCTWSMPWCTRSPTHSASMHSQSLRSEVQGRPFRQRTRQSPLSRLAPPDHHRLKPLAHPDSHRPASPTSERRPRRRREARTYVKRVRQVRA